MLIQHLLISQVIIPACWIFAVAANLPPFLVTKFDEKTRDCRLNLPKDWMNAANDISWLVLLACIPFALMIGLYSRVVYELWFKPRDDLEVVCRHKVITIHLVSQKKINSSANSVTRVESNQRRNVERSSLAAFSWVDSFSLRISFHPCVVRC